MVKSFSAGVSCSQQFFWPVAAALASAEIFRRARQPRYRVLAALIARGLQVIFAPLEIRGRRECRVRAAPAVSCAMCTESARMSIQGSGEHPTFPAQGRVRANKTKYNQ